MFKNTLVIVTIILVSLFFRVLGLTNSEYELELKVYNSYSFTQTKEKQSEKDFYGSPIKASIPSNIPDLVNNPYEFSTIEDRRFVKAKDQFEINFDLTPIEQNPTNKEFYNCYRNLEYKVIDDRFYSVPVLSNDTSKPITNSAITILSNQYRVIPAYSVMLGSKIVEPESNYNFYKVNKNEVTSITTKEDINSEPFTICITSTSGKYSTRNQEGLDLIYSATTPENRNTVHNVLRRSVLGTNDQPSINIDLENQRIRTLKNPNPPKDTTNTNNLFLFLFYGIPLLAIIFFLYRLITRFKNK